MALNSALRDYVYCPLNFPIKEFDLFPKSQIYKDMRTVSDLDGLVAIPGDFFLNWRSGARRLVPFDFTTSRFRNSLSHAFDYNGVVHLWLHPHNLITGDRQAELFNECVGILNEEIQKGRITALTQSQFVKTVA